MSVATLKRITAEAKRIRKKHPNTKWVNAVKQASKKLKGKTPKRKPAAKKTVRKVGRKLATRRKSVSDPRHTKTAAHYLAAARAVLIEDLGKAEARKFVATTKTAKRKIQKAINMKKAKLRKVC